MQHQSVWILNYKAAMGFSITKMIPALIYFDIFRSKTFLTTKIKEEKIYDRSSSVEGQISSPAY